MTPMPGKRQNCNMSKTVLIVDDEPDLLKLTVLRLQKAGYEVQTASDDRTTFELLEKGKTDLVLLDFQLPDLTGGEICKKIRRHEMFKHIPVVVFSAIADIGKLTELVKKAGAQACLAKPGNFQDLLDCIGQLLKRGKDEGIAKIRHCDLNSHA